MLGRKMQAEPFSHRRELALNGAWHDWRWQAKHAITTLHALNAALNLSAEEQIGAARALEQGLPISITPYYLELCDRSDPSCPIRMQCVPRAAESTVAPGDLRDPLGEEHHEVAPNLVRRYPDRVLLIATDRCSVYCRFCTRSRLVGNGGGARSAAALKPAFEWIRSHPEIRDVIVSGGDPLLMSTGRLEGLLGEIATIPHVDTIRLATRAPVTIPQRVTDELCGAIRGVNKAVWVMTHFNHPKELTTEAMDACALLTDHGLPVMNQTVLLRGVNDHAQTLSTLFRGLVRNRVRPYYLLQMDPVSGTSHLRTPLRRGISLMRELQGRISGIAVPKFIVDTPGGRGKVPAGPNYILKESDGTTTLETFRGERVDYIDPPCLAH